MCRDKGEALYTTECKHAGLARGPGCAHRTGSGKKQTRAVVGVEEGKFFQSEPTNLFSMMLCGERSQLESSSMLLACQRPVRARDHILHKMMPQAFLSSLNQII